MADLTQGAVASLLGVLITAVKKEADLQKAVERDIQFIKDEMDSMNGFLLHLTKSGNEHDDQQRAWMKQVRDIAYASQDCIELYNLYSMTPPCVVDFLPNYVRGKIERHKLAKKIKELKERVKDVGERRERYGVTVPAMEHKKRSDGGSGAGDDVETMNEARGEFLEALREDEEDTASIDGRKDEAAAGLSSPSILISFSTMVRRWMPRPPFDNAIRKLAPELAPHALKIRGALLKHKADGARRKMHDDRRRPHDAVAVSMGMVLRALHAFPQSRVGNKEELDKLMEALDAADLPKRVLTFCYSELTTDEKSCLQYLAAFRQEKSISRTSLVRRCTAERLVGEDKERQLAVEQRAESCFEELLFRGFISPAPAPDAYGAAGKVKRCQFRSESVKEFILEMCKAENFVGGGLPVHLRIQNDIRTAALEQHQRKQLQQRDDQLPRICMPLAAVAGNKQMRQNDPINKMLGELSQLPKSYRLNVMDLGGCIGILKRSHLVSICKIRTLKYLSLRNTDVGVLPSQLQDLPLLETLDIRQTNIRHGSRSHALLPRSLKHLLAGNVDSQGDAPNATVRIPDSTREMVNLEVLAHVKVCHRRELRKVENLTKLRKLGVVFIPGNEDGMMKDLLRAVRRLSGCLHSLSVRMERPPLNDWITLDGDMSSPDPSNLVSLRIDGLRTSGLPTWAERLYKLQKITMCNTTLTDQKLGALSDLPHLVCLRLRHKSYNGRELAFRKKPGGFPSLKFLWIENVLVVTELTFQADSAPKLEKIVWSSADHATDDALVAAITVSVAGVENLPKLRKVVLKGLREQHPSTLTKDIAKHPNHPRFITHGH